MKLEQTWSRGITPIHGWGWGWGRLCHQDLSQFRRLAAIYYDIEKRQESDAVPYKVDITVG